MPAQINEIVKRRVIQQWLAGETREKIIADNTIASGTINTIVDDYKTRLDNFELDSFRELILEARKRGLTSSDLASFFRLYNFFQRSGAKENERVIYYKY
jgi:2-phospho-L-lactate guanylyltransferase (CobY/MobA/RfbA family)